MYDRSSRRHAGRCGPQLLALLLLVSASGAPVLAGPGGAEPEPGSLTEGIPPIPPVLVSEVGRYTNARAAEILSWHPQRR
jgi:hypothetical protein